MSFAIMKVEAESGSEGTQMEATRESETLQWDCNCVLKRKWIAQVERDCERVK